MPERRELVFKEWGGRITVALIFPNSYSLGMSNLGFQSVYNLFNSIDDVVCERGFLPDRAEMKEFIHSETRLFSLESQRPLDAFDLVAFSIPFEEDFLHIPEILRLAAIPTFSSERGDGHPLVMAGGVAVSLNPEPLAEFIDLFAIGEGESFLPTFVDALREGRGVVREGAYWRRWRRWRGFMSPTSIAWSMTMK